MLIGPLINNSDCGLSRRIAVSCLVSRLILSGLQFTVRLGSEENGLGSGWADLSSNQSHFLSREGVSSAEPLYKHRSFLPSDVWILLIMLRRASLLCMSMLRAHVY